MSEYIANRSGLGRLIKAQRDIGEPSEPNAYPFPLLFALLREVEEMSQGTTKTSKPRGRRAGIKVPCDDCITNASRKKENTGAIELCDNCTAVLHRPKGKLARRASEHSNPRRGRKHSKTIIDPTGSTRTEPIDLSWSDDRREQHALQFFVTHSAPQLAGYFDSPFWQRMVLQAARHEPAVKYAVAGIGALHEKLLTGAISEDQSGDRNTRFALEQCNKSIQHLMKAPEEGKKPDLRLMLTTCVLFTCFEALQGHCEQAIIHATQGYNLLQQYAMDPDNNRLDVGAFAVELDQLCLLLRRLQTQSKGLMGKDFNAVPDAHAFQAQRPKVFNSLHEARAGLELVLNQLTVFFLDMELDDQFYDLAVSTAEKHLLFGPWLQAWEEAFSSFLSDNQLGPEDRKAAMVLKAHQIVAEILSDVDLSLGELGWDAFNDKFSAIVELAVAVLEDTTKSDESVIEARWKTNGVFISSPTATLSFSLGIVDPLYEVCARCRDPALRRKALDLLARHPRQECVWSSWSAWKVGKFLMRLEEEGSDNPPKQSSDIPLENRVSEAWLDFSEKPLSEGRGRVGYKMAVPRATARYALNPGLFGEWSSENGNFREDDTKSVASDSMDSNMQIPLDDISVEATELNGFRTPAWVDFNEQIGELPIIQDPALEISSF